MAPKDVVTFRVAKEEIETLCADAQRHKRTVSWVLSELVQAYNRRKDVRQVIHGPGAK